MTDEEQLIARYVEPNPYQHGADEAWIVGYGVPVWAIIGAIYAAKTTEAVAKQMAEAHHTQRGSAVTLANARMSIPIRQHHDQPHAGRGAGAYTGTMA